MFHRESGYYKTSYAADMALYPLPVARWTVAAVFLAMCIAPFLLHEYYVSILNLILVATIGALGLNILVGYPGQISIGHAAFMSVGAYTAANLAVRLDLPFWVTLPAGGLIVGVVENLAAGYLDPLVGGGTKDFAPYVLMILMLMIRPYGIFGKRRIERV